MSAGSIRFAMSVPRATTWLAGAAALSVALLAAAPAAAQELNFTFTNPSFGGNPFYSSHLLGIATAQRPDKATSPTQQLSQTQLFAQQLQSRLLSSLSASLATAITGSKPGDSGDFVIGDQRITFENNGTTIKVTIFNQVTGETTDISVPVFNFSGSSTTTRSVSAEAVLSGELSATQSSSAGSLESQPVEPPVSKTPL